MSHICRTYRIEASGGSTLCLGAVSRKQAVHFFSAIRPEAMIVNVEEIVADIDNADEE